MSSQTYDYIVIGSGAAGSVLADRLSASGEHTVCVVEAGGVDSHPFIHLPAGFVKTLNRSDLMWDFASQPAPGSGNRAVRLPQGKVLGGSTSINGLVYNRGQPDDFDQWHRMGNPGWAYQDVLPYFRKTETWGGQPSQTRGSVGPMTITNPLWRDPLCQSFVATMVSLGVPENDDYNDGVQHGAGFYQRFIQGRRRVSAATSYLKSARRRRNVVIRTHTRASRIITEAGRATGLECVRVEADGALRGDAKAAALILHARREIIVSAGTINSPRLLQLSGIGDGDHLQSLGVPVVHHRPAVGNHLQDHYFVRCTARLNGGVVSLNQRAKGWRLAMQVLRWGLGLPNVLALSPSMAFAFINAELSHARPDYQFVFSPGSYKPGRVYELDDFPAITVGFTQQRPSSLGHVRIVSPELDGSLEIQPNYLSTEYDQQAVIAGTRLCQRIFTEGELGKLVQTELTPGEHCTSDDALLRFAREHGNTGYHLVGTCRMGPEQDPGTVVSPELRVHGLDGLRVVDASVMPVVPSSNTCASTLMIAEKAADMILHTNH